MATQKEANKAREQHHKLLISKGVHSIGIDVIGKKGSKNFGVIAMIEKKTDDLPEVLTITTGKKKVEVPLITQVHKKFKAE